MEEAAAPEGPHGETSLSCRRNRRTSATPSVAALGAGDAKHNIPGAQRRTVAPAGLLGLQPLPNGI
eukprot:13475316-Alexandrium_andersonii.AAC.1